MLKDDSLQSPLDPHIDEKLFRLLVASVKDYAIYLIDQNGHILSWNQGAEYIKGYQAQEIVGKHISLFYTPEDNRKNQPRINLNAALKNGIKESEGWRLRKDGSRFWANVVFTTLYNDSGHLIGFAKVVRDITQQKKLEDEKAAINIELEKRVIAETAKIVANELRFRKLIENSYDGISLLDNNLQVIYRSHSSERIIGWTDKERTGYEFTDLVHPDDQVLFTALFDKVLHDPGEPYFLEYRAKHKLGHYIWMECIFTNMLYDENISAIVCNFRDVSAHKKAKQEITLLNETLEKKVTDRTLQLQEANQELESFSYSVSHDLRTPLRAVNGYANMLKEDFENQLGEEGKRIINTIADNARLMGQLIDDLLTFSRLGRKELIVHEVDIRTLVQTCISELLEQHSGTYHVAVQELPPCMADSNMLKQVWMNLLSNAIKYSAKTENPQIRIGSTKANGEQTYFVQDNGVGFDMQYSDKLFGVFQRLHRNDEFEGNGVGLALVKRIISKHGGKIWAESTPGKGAAFYFTLPCE